MFTLTPAFLRTKFSQIMISRTAPSSKFIAKTKHGKGKIKKIGGPGGAGVEVNKANYSVTIIK